MYKNNKNKMEAYYTKEFNIEGETQEVSLYKYSLKSIAMVSTEKFGKGFSKNLKDIGGRFNPKLSVGAGWIFKIDSETQGKITKFLKGVFTGEIKWETGDVKMPIIENQEIDQKIFITLNELMDFIPSEKEDRMISEKDGFKTFVYYNKDDSVVTQGETIYRFESAHRSLEITQLTE
jgi:hypothetical protein